MVWCLSIFNRHGQQKRVDTRIDVLQENNKLVEGDKIMQETNEKNGFLMKVRCLCSVPVPR